MTPEAPGRTVSRQTAWLVAIVATLTMTVSYIDRATLAVLAPTVTKVLDISETEYGWLTSAFSIAYLVATPASGWMIDRIGARRGLVGSILVWTTVAALHAVVPGFGILFALRIALGVAEGPSFPGAAQTMQRILPATDRERGFGVLFTGSSIGGMIAPPLAAFLFGIAGWRLAFVGTALVGLIWIPLWIAITSRRDVRRQLDIVPVERSTEKVRFAELIANPNMIRALIAIFAVAPVFGFALSWGAKFLAREYGVTQTQVGHFLWLPPLMFDVGTIAFGDAASRQRRPPGAPPRLLFAGAMLMAATLALLPFATTPWQAMAIIGVAMAGGGAVYALTTADLLARVPQHAVSFAGGTLAAAQSLALIIANPLVGASIDHWHTYDTAVTVTGLWALPGCIYWLVAKPRR
jgi:ACS family hexuronate transporter-like MFS transporter